MGARWSRRPGWSEAHRAALAGGALVAHTAIGALMFADAPGAGPVNIGGLVLIGAAELAATVIAVLRWSRSGTDAVVGG